MYLCTFSKTALWGLKFQYQQLSDPAVSDIVLLLRVITLLYMRRSIFIEASKPVLKFHAFLLITKLETFLLSEQIRILSVHTVYKGSTPGPSILGGDNRGDFNMDCVKKQYRSQETASSVVHDKSHVLTKDHTDSLYNFPSHTLASNECGEEIAPHGRPDKLEARARASESKYNDVKTSPPSPPLPSSHLNHVVLLSYSCPQSVSRSTAIPSSLL